MLHPFHCVRHYLQHGIPALETSETVRRKQVRISFGEEFWSWFSEYSGNGCGDWKLFGELYTQFLGENDMDKKDYTQKRFKRALEDSAGLFGFTLISRKNRQAANKVEIKMQKSGEENNIYGTIGYKSVTAETPF